MTEKKIIQLNIEGDKHLDRISEFLKDENPDIVCLQEVLSKDVEYFRELLNMDAYYTPTHNIKKENKLQLTSNNLWGIMMLTNLKNVDFVHHYYVGSPEKLPEFSDDSGNSESRAVIVMSTKIHITYYSFAATHFTWTEGGIATNLQLEHLEHLLSFLSPYENLVLSGDFNAPRGRDAWAKLAETYVDNVPSEEKSTLDQELHRIKDLQYVVDGIFTTPGIKVSNVRVKDNLSDHKAIIATVTLQ